MLPDFYMANEGLEDAQVEHQVTSEDLVTYFHMTTGKTSFLVFYSQSFSTKPPAILDLLHQDTPPTRMTYFSPANMNVEKVRWRPDMGGCKSGRREREVAKRGTDHTKHKTREAYIERLDKRLGRRR